MLVSKMFSVGDKNMTSELKTRKIIVWSLQRSRQVTSLETLHVWSAALLFWTPAWPRRPAAKRRDMSLQHCCARHCPPSPHNNSIISWNIEEHSYLWGLPEDINHYFDRQPWTNFLHSLYTPPVCLETAGRRHGFHTEAMSEWSRATPLTRDHSNDGR